uniref:Uncharacterized protein n=1 Tax=Nelumbo nucifera TaxID=4432 RepID=A0A822YQT6_NELNU|nr:TPA_asm: hypothetical protein HUJ06_012792 [Nelumbo nucifera]
MNGLNALKFDLPHVFVPNTTDSLYCWRCSPVY